MSSQDPEVVALRDHLCLMAGLQEFEHRALPDPAAAAEAFMVKTYGPIPSNPYPEDGDTPEQDHWMARFGLLVQFASALLDQVKGGAA